jgi:hypothetical protein
MKPACMTRELELGRGASEAPIARRDRNLIRYRAGMAVR